MGKTLEFPNACDCVALPVDVDALRGNAILLDAVLAAPTPYTKTIIEADGEGEAISREEH